MVAARSQLAGKSSSLRTLVFQSLVHSRLAPGGGSSEGTSAPRPSSAGERVTSGSSPEPLARSHGVGALALSWKLGAAGVPLQGIFQFQQSCALHLLALGATSSSPKPFSLGEIAAL